MEHVTSLPQANAVTQSSVAQGTGALPGLTTLEADWPTLSVLSRRYIERALQHTRGNKTRAADLLGIDRRTLNRILARERARRTPPAAAAE